MRLLALYLRGRRVPTAVAASGVAATTAALLGCAGTLVYARIGPR